MQIRTKIEKGISRIEYTGTNVTPFYRVSVTIPGVASLGKQCTTLADARKARDLFIINNHTLLKKSKHRQKIEVNKQVYDSINKLKIGEFYELRSHQNKAAVFSVFHRMSKKIKSKVLMFSGKSCTYYILKIK